MDTQPKAESAELDLEKSMDMTGKVRAAKIVYQKCNECTKVYQVQQKCSAIDGLALDKIPEITCSKVLVYSGVKHRQCSESIVGMARNDLGQG